MITQFATTILYTQVTVSLGADAPALAWTDDHVAQGFAWAPGTATFGVPDHDGECLIRVSTAAAVATKASSLWAICVPFDVSRSPILIGTIMNDRDVDVPRGVYSLMFEASEGGEIEGHDCTYVFDLTFCADPHPDFRILKQGPELTTDVVLRRDAEPA